MVGEGRHLIVGPRGETGADVVGQPLTQYLHGAFSLVGQGQQRGTSVRRIGFPPHKPGRLQPGGASGDARPVEPDFRGQVSGAAWPGPSESAEDRVCQLVYGLPHAGGEDPVQLNAGTALE